MSVRVRIVSPPAYLMDDGGGLPSRRCRSQGIAVPAHQVHVRGGEIWHAFLV